MVTKWYNPLHDCKDFGIHYIPADYDVNVVSRFSPSMIKCIQTTEKYVDIPEEILHYYMKYRETPLRRMRDWEEKIGALNPIFIKDETDNCLGSYKMNTAFAHAYFAKKDGFDGIVGETLAGHWGLALAFACQRFGLKCVIVIHESFFERKENYIHLIEELGASVVKCSQKGDPLATSRTMALKIAEDRQWAYAVGCSFPHVLVHQSVVGMELIEQTDRMDISIQNIVACCGSGSNLGGISLPVIAEYEKRGKNLRIFAGVRNRNEEEVKLEAKGLTGHNLSKVILNQVNQGRIELNEVSVAEAKEANREFFLCEGYLLAPETGYAIATAKKIVLQHLIPEGENIIINLSGRAYWEHH